MKKKIITLIMLCCLLGLAGCSKEVHTEETTEKETIDAATLETDTYASIEISDYGTITIA